MAVLNIEPHMDLKILYMLLYKLFLSWDAVVSMDRKDNVGLDHESLKFKASNKNSFLQQITIPIHFYF